MKVLYFDCFSGISGDMVLGTLVDLGLDPEHLRSELAKINLDGYEISVQKTEKHKISATKVNVNLEEDEHHHHHENNHDDNHTHNHNHNHNHNHEHTHNHAHEQHHHEPEHHSRNLNDIRDLINASDLEDNVKETAISIFTRLGEAEAKVHGTTIDKVHFHEVGAVDSIVDIGGASIGIHALGIEKVYSSPPSLGSGFSKSSHGIIPVPVPATVELLKGRPVRQTDIKFELVTPTGAAIISTLAEGFGSMPDNMIIDKVGYGSGSRDLAERPNLLRGFMGHIQSIYEHDIISVVETNIDDMSPQIYDILMDKLLGLGAVDVFMIPIVMKKSRPAVKLTVLTDQKYVQDICDSILAETTTIGVRIYKADRKKLAREIVDVETPYGKIKAKLARMGSNVIKVIPEYDDCKKISQDKNVPFLRVQQSVLDSWHNKESN
ncbi:nickel pincer cofactor biosynthesis protein LarC [Candidatus Poribacteria bacterium]|nr:nickel pincer cofactor biosynthesis protein LarC [Candidatus Poribacteria bacterium]